VLERNTNNAAMEECEIISKQPVVASHAKNTDDKKASPLPNSDNTTPDIVPQERFKHGMCNSCGWQIHKTMQDEESSSCRMVALTIPGAVTLGRYLCCHPDNLKDDNQHHQEHDNHWNISSENGLEQTTGEPFSSFESHGNDGDNKHGMLHAESDHPQSSSNRTVRLQDGEGTACVGVIAHGTANKGRGVFSFTHKDGLYEGQSEIHA